MISKKFNTVKVIVKTIPLIFGLGGILIFLLTGVYMFLNFPGLYKNNESIRMAYRAGHIYILMSSLLNLTIAFYLKVHKETMLYILQLIGSFLLIISQPVFIFAFFFESSVSVSARFISFFGVLFVLMGIVLHGMSHILQHVFKDPQS